ncbi:MAG: aldo/keto reductase, partial [Gemmatimonadetes bacterium]|nr:aldo/keto reductase [Gemmatimonadota bacterium]
RELIDAGTLGRDEVIIVSKIGYIQGGNYQAVQEREAQGSPFPELVKYADGLWHCIHPAFLADQLQ